MEVKLFKIGESYTNSLYIACYTGREFGDSRGVISWNSAGLRGLTHRKERSQPIDLFLEIRYKYKKFSLGFQSLMKLQANLMLFAHCCQPVSAVESCS